MAGRASVTLIRQTLGEHGLTQPQWWSLNYVTENPGVGIAEVVDYHRGFVDTDDQLRPDVLRLVADGLLRSVDESLTITDAGARRRSETWPAINDALATLRGGVTDSDFITTIRTLQRVLDNAGAVAWHA